MTMTMTRDVSSGSRIILVDDSINSGQTMRKSVDVVSARIGEKPVTVCAYACDATKSLVDFYYESVPFPRVWEWNVFHHILLRVAGCDIDGVICPEPHTDEQSDPAGYVREIESAPYIRRITYKVRAFVTSRLEKHRASTENWLRSHGVRYDELVMSRHADVESRRAFSDHAKQKAQAIVSRGLQMFIESSSEQAQAISLFARVPVLCTDTNTMHNPKG
jgi:uncharacterized HAD superfamily protein